MNRRDLFNFREKVAVVVGGAGLIGEAVARGLAGLGATVVVADADCAKAKTIAAELKALGHNVVAFTLDMSKEGSVSRLVTIIKKMHGCIDICVNAAYPRTEDWSRKFEDVASSSWRKNVDMHLNGYFIACQKIAEEMKKQRSGSIINFASIYGMVGPDFSIYKGTSMTMPAAYSAIKGGIISFTKYMASYYGAYNVRINCISPGGVYDSQPKGFVKRYSAKVPLKRMARTDDIVGGVLYLASDASGYVTGHNLVIDGGWSAV